MTSFTSGLPAIDHNLYVRDGFIFEANYRSGLRIFNANVDPLNPPQVGWFDTYPENDNRGFNGAWSNYPFFPSGTVIVSDIERGLFILDVSQALEVLPSAFTVTRGAQTGGGLQDLFFSDDSYLLVEARRPTEIAAASVELVVEGASRIQTPAELRFNFEGATSGEPAIQRIELFNFLNSTWEVVDERKAPTEDTIVVVTITTNPERFVQAGTRLVRARIGYHDRGVTFISWDGRFDRCTWTVRG